MPRKRKEELSPVEPTIELVESLASAGETQLKGLDNALTLEMQRRLVTLGYLHEEDATGKWAITAQEGYAEFIRDAGLDVERYQYFLDETAARALLSPVRPQSAPLPAPVPVCLTDADYVDVAAFLGCTVPVLRAVVDVESSGSGYDHGGKVRITLQAHTFSALTRHQFDCSHDDISSRYYNAELYQGGNIEWVRYRRAAGIAPTEAILATSWGLFQVLGMHHKECGYQTPLEFAERMTHGGEREHLFAFARQLKTYFLDEMLAVYDFEGFTLAYNGPARQLDYSEQLKVALSRYC